MILFGFHTVMQIQICEYNRSICIECVCIFFSLWVFSFRRNESLFVYAIRMYKINDELENYWLFLLVDLEYFVRVRDRRKINHDSSNKKKYGM